ncbi:MAG TPA: ZPR1 zinc finger domain-containing protein [Methanoregula sp.]|nr:ZPR1 zinc finger domain-containing protein [Methanoregula sp.]
MRTGVLGPCPCCNTEIEYNYQTENIPYFDDILIISAICSSCGYKYVDTQLLTDNEPVRYELKVEGEEDLAIRVVRSMSASLEIPELGVRIDPGPACQGFVSNIEGVLDRVEQILKGALHWGDDTERENAQTLLEKIAGVKSGTVPITLILEDRCGNSAIIADKTQKSVNFVDPEQ